MEEKQEEAKNKIRKEIKRLSWDKSRTEDKITKLVRQLEVF